MQAGPRETTPNARVSEKARVSACMGGARSSIVHSHVPTELNLKSIVQDSVMKLTRRVFPLLHILFLCCDCYSYTIGNTARSSNVSDKEPIYILTLLPYYNPEPSLNPSFTIGDDAQPAMELAKIQINDNQSMLENYTLQLVHAQGGCEFLTTTSSSFVEETFRPDGRRLRGIIGPSCSSSTISLAPLTNRSELGIIMIHGSGSPTLSDRREYRYLLSTLGSTTAIVQNY